MEQTFSQDFKRVFLLTFTKELIIHSEKRDITKLQNIIKSKEQGRKERYLGRQTGIFTREIEETRIPVQRVFEMPVEVQPTREMEIEPTGGDIEIPGRIFENSVEIQPTREVGEIRIPVQRAFENRVEVQPMIQPARGPIAMGVKPKPPIKQFTKQMIRYPLFIPEPKLPEHLEYLKPIPTPGVEIDLFKLNPLIKDPAVRIIEVNPNERVVVGGTMGTRPTNIVLNEEDIDRVINKFSEVSKIPTTEGIYKIVVGNLIFSAIVSETVNSKFIIKKMLIIPNPPEIQQQKYQTFPFQNNNLG